MKGQLSNARRSNARWFRRTELLTLLMWLSAALASFLPRGASAYTLNSGFTFPCHEQLSGDAILRLVEGVDLDSVPLPADARWEGASAELFTTLSEKTPHQAWRLDSGKKRFVAFSLLLGVRYPDTRGHSITDLNALRRIHADSTGDGQYAHCLRAEDDDGPSADLTVIEKTKEVIRGHVLEFESALNHGQREQLLQTEMYLDHYGLIVLEVWKPAFELGRSLHAVQDCFSHTIRTEDGRYVLSVLNFVDALDGHVVEARDGKPHSGQMDACGDPRIAELVEEANSSSVAMVEAAVALSEGDERPLNQGLTDCAGDSSGTSCGWLEYLPSCRRQVQAENDLEGGCCSPDTNYCDPRWMPVVNTDPTRPFLGDALGCSMRRPGSNARSGAKALVALALVALMLGYRRRRGAIVELRSHPAVVLLVAFTSLLSSMPAHASDSTEGGSFLAAEAHGSALTDATNESPIDVSFGPMFRGGYRFGKSPFGGRWGVIGVVEHNWWVTSEQTIDVVPGVLNLGAGLELLYGKMFRTSAAVGTSTLLFDAPFHDSGATGLYVEFRPLGLRFRMGKHWALTLDPLSGTWISPAFSDPNLSQFQYRFTVGVEWRQGGRPQTRGTP